MLVDDAQYSIFPTEAEMRGKTMTRPPMIEVDVTQEFRKGGWDGEAHQRGDRYYEYMYQLPVVR